MSKLALVMIARNEERAIKRALDSVRPYVDEMIVVDTGSTDNTITCAQNVGAKVFEFTWCDDFSKARNTALDHSNADWNFILDADEVLTDGGEILKSIASLKSDFVGAISIDSGYGASGEEQHVRNWLVRLLPSHIRFSGRIHEQPIHTLPIKHLDIHCHHDGYLPALRNTKKGRNEFLLKAEIQNFPNDPYLHYQLGKEMEVDQDFTLAVKSYQTSLSLLDKSFENWHRDLVIRCLFCMKKIKNFEHAMRLASQWQHVLDPIPDFHFVLGDLCLDMAIDKPADAEAILPLIESHWLRCLEIGEKPEIDGCVKGRGSILAAHNLHAFYTSLGMDEHAALYQSYKIRE